MTFFILGVTGVFGADIHINSVVSPTKASINSYLTLRITISGTDARKAGRPILKNTPDFDVRSRGQSTQYRFINGQSSYDITYTYTLIPKKTGIFEIGGAAVSDGSINYGAKETKVEIVAAMPDERSTQRSSATEANENIFIKTHVDNEKPYVGQQITLTFELYNRLTLWGDTNYEPPSTTGFWAVGLPKIAPATKVMGNRLFQYNAIKTALFPTTSGELTIGPAALTYNTGGFFSSQRSRVLRSKEITIDAQPLPVNGKPANFSGAVGNYTISAAADITSIKVGDVVTVTVTVAGTGNLDLITSLNSPDISAFKSYDPKVSETITNSGFVVGGGKTWEYILMPKSEGKLSIGPFTLSFFNPDDRSYHTLSTEEINLTVAPGEAAALDQLPGSSRRNAIQNISNDIHYIKPYKSILKSTDKKVFTNVFFYLLYILPVSVFSAVFIIKRKRDEIERNTGLKRKLNAWKKSQKHMNDASLLKDSGDREAFYGKLSEALTGFIGDSINIDTGALTADVLDEILRDHNVGPELAEQTRKTLELCDFFRFSSTGSGHEMQDKLLNETHDILEKLRGLL